MIYYASPLPIEDFYSFHLLN